MRHHACSQLDSIYNIMHACVHVTSLIEGITGCEDTISYY